MPSIADTRSGTPAWLLDLDVGGRVFRFASRSVSVSAADGQVFEYREGLAPLSLTTTDGGDSSVSVSVESSDDWAGIVASGSQVERRSAVVRRWWPSQALEQAQVYARGKTQGVEYGAPTEPLTLSIERSYAKEAFILPDPQAVIDDVTWPDDHGHTPGDGFAMATKAEGVGYPVIFGCPGHNPERGLPLAAVPVVSPSFKETSGTTVDTSKMLIADRRIHATNVKLWNVSISESDTRAVQTTTDALGRTISYVDFQSSTLSAANETHALWIGFQDEFEGLATVFGGGIMNDEQTAPIRGAGDVIEWVLLNLTALDVDVGRMAASKSFLNAFKVDSYINARVNAWEWLEREVFRFLPVMVRESSEGVYVVPMRWDASPTDVMRRLSVERGDIRRDGSVRTLSQDVVNEFTIDYRGVQGGSKWYARRVVTAQPGRPTHTYLNTDERIYGSMRCKQSQSVFGVIPQVYQAPSVWDHPTASLIVNSLVARYTLPKQMATYVGGSELETVEVGDVVSITDAECSITDRLGIVIEQTVSDSAVSIEVLLLDPTARS